MANIPFGTPSAELALDGELRRQLGLSPDEVLRVLNTNGHFVLLERTEGTRTIAVPWDRSLVLSADVRSFPLADILSMIHDAGESGFLAFESAFEQPAPESTPKSIPTSNPSLLEASASSSLGPSQRTHEGAATGSRGREIAVYFQRGEVVFAASSDPADRLGHSLLRSGRLTLAELREAERAYSPADRFGKALVERGLLSPRELWNAVKHQVEDIVRSLLTHTHGQVYFWEGDVQPDNVVRLVLPTRRLVTEGLRRRDEIFRFLALLEDRRVALHAVPELAGRLTGNDRALYEELATTSEFGPACHRAGLDPLTGARVVQLLSLLGAVRVERLDGDADAAPNETESLRESVTDRVKLLAELVSPLVAVDGSDRVSERFAAVVRESADQHPELFEGLAIGAGATLDPEDLVERSLRLAGDRSARASQALGELIAYVEFELMNHPGIADPQQFLEALEPLRARIR